MNARAAFGLSILMSLLSSIVVAYSLRGPGFEPAIISKHSFGWWCRTCFFALLGSVFCSWSYVRVPAASLGCAGRVRRLCRWRTCHHCHHCASGRLHRPFWRCGYSISGAVLTYCLRSIKGRESA